MSAFLATPFEIFFPLFFRVEVLNEKVFRLGYPVIDTVSLAWLAMPQSERQNLNALRECLEIETEGAHEAVKDVHDCRSVFWHCASKIIETF